MRRALRLGEKEAVPRISDLEALVTSSAGKLELEYAGQERSEDDVVRQLMKRAVRVVFDGAEGPESLVGQPVPAVIGLESRSEENRGRLLGAEGAAVEDDEGNVGFHTHFVDPRSQEGLSRPWTPVHQYGPEGLVPEALNAFPDLAHGWRDGDERLRLPPVSHEHVQGLPLLVKAPQVGGVGREAGGQSAGDGGAERL